MNDFDLRATTDNIVSWGALELPISGPAANTLAILTGSVFIGLDVDPDEALSVDFRPTPSFDLHPAGSAGDDRPFSGQLLVDTGYTLPRDARYRDVGGDGGIQQTTYINLARIESDDTDEMLVAIDAADAYVDALDRVVVRMQLEVKGDCTLSGIAYQVHLLLHRDQPTLWGKHPPAVGVGIDGESGA